ncbi:MAG: hypothetical protein JW706_07105, partial [Opitutales bacterium]|nr:hypothetical protein [Opitutales bacterium]
ARPEAQQIRIGVGPLHGEDQGRTRLHRFVPDRLEHRRLVRCVHRKRDRVPTEQRDPAAAAVI